MARGPMANRKPIFHDPMLGTIAGLAFYAAGAYLLWEAYEGRGRQRPYKMKIASGLV